MLIYIYILVLVCRSYKTIRRAEYGLPGSYCWHISSSCLACDVRQMFMKILMMFLLLFCGRTVTNSRLTYVSKLAFQNNFKLQYLWVKSHAVYSFPSIENVYLCNAMWTSHTVKRKLISKKKSQWRQWDWWKTKSATG